MDLKTSLLALLGVGTVSGCVTGGYYLLKSNENLNNQISNNKENQEIVGSVTPENVPEVSPEKSPSSRPSNTEGGQPLSPVPRNQQSSPQTQLSGDGGAAPTSSSNISPS